MQKMYYYSSVTHAVVVGLQILGNLSFRWESSSCHIAGQCEGTIGFIGILWGRHCQCTVAQIVVQRRKAATEIKVTGMASISLTTVIIPHGMESRCATSSEYQYQFQYQYKYW